MTTVFWILGIIAAAFVALVGLAFGFSALLFRFLGRISGLERLAQAYPVAGPRPAPSYRRQRIGVGKAGFSRHTDVDVTAAGLYVWVRPFLSRYQPILLPWAALGKPQETILSLQKAARLTVGAPEITTITVAWPLYEAMAPYLAAAEATRTSQKQAA